LEEALTDLTKQGWLIQGASPTCWLAIPEICRVLPHIAAFLKFLLADLPPQTPAAGTCRDQWLTDLVELAAFMAVELPTLTNKGLLNKQAMRKLMPRLSPLVSADWENALTENRYTPLFGQLLSILDQIGALPIVRLSEKPYYRFNHNKWYDFLFLPFPRRLLQVVVLWLTVVSSRQPNQLLDLYCLLRVAAEANGHWLTGARLISQLANTKFSANFSGQDPFAEEYWLQETLLEPLLDLGLMEQTQAQLPTPWSKTATGTRLLWRLSPRGLALANWFTKYNSISAAYQQLTTETTGSAAFSSQITSLLDQWTQLSPEEPDQELILQPDLSFIAPRTSHPFLLWTLSVFGETAVQDYVYQGSFSRTSILKALKANMTIEELTDTLADHCKIPPADNVWQTITSWSSAYDKTLLAHALLLACETPEMAVEIAAQTKLAAHILGQIGPQVLLISPQGETAIRKWLDKKNWVPRPGIASATTLQQWLTK
jgi:hypothetical protein